MSFRVEYEVGNAGWAHCRVALGDSLANMTASYLHDSLRQLCEVVATIATGAQYGTVVFMDEPGEHHLNFKRLGLDNVQVEVVWHDDWSSWGTGAESQGRIVMQGSTTVASLITETLVATDQILETLGTTEYRRRWIEHDFPIDAHDELRRLAQ